LHACGGHPDSICLPVADKWLVDNVRVATGRTQICMCLAVLKIQVFHWMALVDRQLHANFACAGSYYSAKPGLQGRWQNKYLNETLKHDHKI